MRPSAIRRGLAWSAARAAEVGQREPADAGVLIAVAVVVDGVLLAVGQSRVRAGLDQPERHRGRHHGEAWAQRSVARVDQTGAIGCGRGRRR